MTIQRCAVELRHHIHLVDVGVNAVANRNIDQSIFTCQGDCRLRPHLRKGIETGTSTAAKNNRQNSLHAATQIGVAGRTYRRFRPENHPWA